MVEICTYLYVLHLPFLLLFLGGLFGVLRRAEGDSGALSISALGAGIAMVVIASMCALISALTPTIGQLGWTGLALGLTSLVLTGTLVAPTLFPLLGIGTLLFVVWVATLTIVLLRRPRTVGRVAPPGDDASRVPGELYEM